MGWVARVMSTTWRVARQAVHTARWPPYEVAGRGRRALAWQPGNPGVKAALFASGAALRARSRDLARRNPWAANALEAFVANCIGTGIKPQSMAEDAGFRAAVHALWWEWTEEADAAGLTDFQGLQALAEVEAALAQAAGTRVRQIRVITNKGF